VRLCMFGNSNVCIFVCCVFFNMWVCVSLGFVICVWIFICGFLIFGCVHVCFLLCVCVFYSVLWRGSVFILEFPNVWLRVCVGSFYLVLCMCVLDCVIVFMCGFSNTWEYYVRGFNVWFCLSFVIEMSSYVNMCVFLMSGCVWVWIL